MRLDWRMHRLYCWGISSAFLVSIVVIARARNSEPIALARARAGFDSQTGYVGLFLPFLLES